MEHQEHEERVDDPPKEHWIAVLRCEPPDRLPLDYWGTAEATRKVRQHLGCATQWQMFEWLHIDRVVTARPEYVGPPLPQGYDMYGIGNAQVLRLIR